LRCSPAGFEGFEEMGMLGRDPRPAQLREVADRYGQTIHPELVAELTQRYRVTV
jgi:hypothetical protein